MLFRSAQVTPFFFYSIGGYLVIQQELTLGALVAALAAYKDLSAPWKELLNYYQIMEDARIKYDLLIETFQPDGLLSGQSLEEYAGVLFAGGAGAAELVGDEDALRLAREAAAEGKLRTVIDRIVPLSEAPAMHELLENTPGVGKVILEPQKG